MCLGADVLRGKDQQPFDGKLPYDFVMWIDSEMVFSVENFLELLKKDEDIIAGAYLRDNGKDFSCVEKLDNDYVYEKKIAELNEEISRLKNGIKESAEELEDFIEKLNA